MNLLEQRMACLRMAIEMGCEPHSVVKTAGELYAFLTDGIVPSAEPAAAPAPEPVAVAAAEEPAAAAEPAVEDAPAHTPVIDPVAACALLFKCLKEVPSNSPSRPSPLSP